MTDMRNIPINFKTSDYLLAGKESMIAKRREIIPKYNEFNDKLDGLIFCIKGVLVI